MNKTKNANSFLKKLKGLMFELKKKFNYALIFEFNSIGTTINAIHMLFVFFPIKAVFLNEEKKVVDITELNPWTLIYIPKKPCKYLIELPKEIQGIKLNDLMEWE